jgi:hypothetical protein
VDVGLLEAEQLGDLERRDVSHVVERIARRTVGVRGHRLQHPLPDGRLEALKLAKQGHQRPAVASRQCAVDWRG